MIKDDGTFRKEKKGRQLVTSAQRDGSYYIQPRIKSFHSNKERDIKCTVKLTWTEMYFTLCFIFSLIQFWVQCSNAQFEFMLWLILFVFNVVDLLILHLINDTLAGKFRSFLNKNIQFPLLFMAQTNWN